MQGGAGMPRHVKTVLDRAPVTHLSVVQAPPSAQGSSLYKAPVVLLDPLAEPTGAYTHLGDELASLEAAQVPTAAGPSIAVRVLQLALLSSVGVVIWLMLSLLQTTG